MGGGKRLFQLFYQTTSLKTFKTFNKLGYYMDTFQIKPINLSLKSALTES